MIRIFLVNNASRAANYGVGTYLNQLAEGLSMCPNMEVSFIDLQSDVKEYLIEIDDDRFTHYKIPWQGARREDERYWRNVFYFLTRHIVENVNSKLVFQFNYFQHYDIALLFKCHYVTCRIVLTVHYLNWCFELKGNKQHFRKLTAKDYTPQDSTERGIRQSKNAERLFLRLADEVLVLSRDTLQILLDDYGIIEEKMHLVYNGCDDSLCTRDVNKTKDNKRIILFVGRLDEIKGLDYLIDAFKEITSKYSDIHLIVVGDGDFQPYLKLSRDVHDRISFMGKMSSEEVEILYQSAYIGVMPSFHEQCSYTAIEMMRHGIPLIGTDTTGLAEMLDATPELRVHIDNDQTGRDNSLSPQIARCLDMLLSDKDVYDRASHAVTEQYNARYTQSTMIDNIQWAIESSFDRTGYVVSNDFLFDLDMKMIALVNQCPDIDIDFYGVSGMGVYLWMRVQELPSSNDRIKYHLSMVLEYLIYYMDWIAERFVGEYFPNELIAVLQCMYSKGFYKTCVAELLHNQPTSEAVVALPIRNEIIKNALKICCCKI